MRNLLFVIFMLVIYLIAGATAIHGNESKRSWPIIQPVVKNFQFVDHQEMGAKLKIVDPDGTPLYLLECYLNAYDHEDKDFDYTGDFECRLTSFYDDHQAHKTLLSAEKPQTRDWQSRGVFYINEIIAKHVEGVPIEYPGYGRVGQFRLRGMNVTLAIKSFKVKPAAGKRNTTNRDRIKELELDITVTSDPTATSEIAEQVKYNATLSSQIKWPEVIPFKKVIHFVDHKETATKLNIVGKSGNPLYLLECYINAYEQEDRDFSYSGDFECRLLSLYDNSHGHNTLLTEEQYPTRDWQSRGRFLLEELTSKCAEYPEYGRVRNFRLRGMNLTIEIKNFRIKSGSDAPNASWNKNRIKKLELDVTVTSDLAVISEIAEPTMYVEPPRAHPEDTNDLSRKCDKVLTK